jgi:ribosomal protein L40E
MPCYRCGARQQDPVKGPSPWKRGVRAGHQVLVCPDCQGTTAWPEDLDRCAACGSTVLVRRLDEIVCRQCGATWPAPAATSPLADADPPPGSRALADDVAAALERVLRRRT